MTATYIHTKQKAGVGRIIERFCAIAYFSAIAASIIYLWFFTQDRYVTMAKFKISSQDSNVLNSQQGSPLAALADAGVLDAQIAINYISAPDLLTELENEFKLVEHYSSPSKDRIFRLDSNALLEERIKYYQKRIYAYYNPGTGLTELTVDTFKPELSKLMAERILIEAESFINLMNQTISRQQLIFASSEVERTSKQVEEVNQEMLALQNANNFISPNEVISANLRAMEALRMQHLNLEAELASLQRDSPNSPRIETVRSQLRSLSELIDIESAKLSGPEKDRLNQLLMEFNKLKIKYEVALSLRTGAQTMMEQTRTTANAQGRFFSVVQKPYLPEKVGIPSRKYATAMILILGFLLFLILRALTRSLFTA